MSADEDIEVHITPSADDILEVSPVNSYSSPVQSNVTSPTSLRPHRSQTNENAFSSSSDEEEDRNTGSRSTGEDESESYYDEDEEDDHDDDSRRQPPPIHSSGSSSTATSSGVNQSSAENAAHNHHNSHHPSSISPSHSNNKSRQASKGNRSALPQSEFDKALLTGVPSRGHATSFFASDNADYSDAASAADSSYAQSYSQAGSRQSQEMRQTRREKERRQPRVNITATTQSSSASVASISSAASSSLPSGSKGNNNHLTKNKVSKYANKSSASFDSSMMHPPNRNTSNSLDYEIPNDLSSGVLPDVLMTMRQKIESMQLFDSDMMKFATSDSKLMDEMAAETRESLKRSSQQSISAAVLVSLAHKRYERRRLAAMEIEKAVRQLVHENHLERVRAILLLLSDDYVRSNNEDARKGGVVALAACAIGLKKAHDDSSIVMECRDLILASVVHACQDHSQRVRYYATESLFNVVKVIPGLAVQHFFILFEILRSLYADTDVDVRSGSELLDKKLKEVIVGAMNSGSFSTDACVPVFARFVYMRNKATKRLTLTWLQELNEKLIGAPILEFLHLFLGGIFDMVSDPSIAIRQSALAFLNSVLPKLLVINSEAIDDMNDTGMKVDFDKILQSLVTTMEHPDPFVRKVAMYWMSKIVKAHMKELHSRNGKGEGESEGASSSNDDLEEADADENTGKVSTIKKSQFSSAASISVRNSLPHVLPGILLSIGDTHHARTGSKDFLPDQTTNELAEQTNACLRDAVRRDGQAYVQHLDSFIVALREELDSDGGLSARNPPAEERKLYRIDVSRDGTGIESPGWFRASYDIKERNEESMVSSRLCALHWIIVLYESVVPDTLKADYAREFIIPIIHQLVDNCPEKIVFKSLEVLAKITVPVSGEDRSGEQHGPRASTFDSQSLSGFNSKPSWAQFPDDTAFDAEAEFPMTDSNASFALDILHPSRRQLKSRDREVFKALIQLHFHNQQLLSTLSKVVAYMCKLQPPEFVFVSFAVELDRFVRQLQKNRIKQFDSMGQECDEDGADDSQQQQRALSDGLKFVASFVQQMCHVLLNADEAKPLRDILRDCVGFTPTKDGNPHEHRSVRLFHIMLHSFSHSVVATVSLCLWGGAYRTASMFLSRIDPLDINLMFLLELDKLIEQLEKPLFRHLHVRMLERNEDPTSEGSGAMLFQTLKFLLMITPQSTCYNVLKDRLVSISRFRQSTGMAAAPPGFLSNQSASDKNRFAEQTEAFVSRVLEVRSIHCNAMWQSIRSESLETKLPIPTQGPHVEEEEARRTWLGYATKDDQLRAEERYRRERVAQQQGRGLTIEELGGYEDLAKPSDSFECDRERDLEDDLDVRQQDDLDKETEGQPWVAYWEET